MWTRMVLAVAHWLLRLAGREAITVSRAVLPLIPAARLVVAQVNEMAPENASGEWKRHQALARMLKARDATGSKVSTHLLALAIELALEP